MDKRLLQLKGCDSMKTYAEYMVYLLHAPFKKVKKEYNNWKALMYVLGNHVAPLKNYIFLIREETAIETAKKSLDIIGKGRRMPRYQAETDEQYRTRLLAKRIVSEMAGTKAGVEYILKTLGYDNAEVLPVPAEMIKQYHWDGAIRFDGSHQWQPFGKNVEHWAEFMVVLPTDNPGTLNNFEILKNEINRVKQASSLAVYKFQSLEQSEFVTINDFDLLSITVETENMSKISTTIESITIPIKFETTNEIGIAGYIDKTFLWNGDYQFNGKKKWKSGLEEMEM